MAVIRESEEFGTVSEAERSLSESQSFKFVSLGLCNASSVGELRAVLGRFTPSTRVVLDPALPVSHGIDIAREQSGGSAVPVIMLTDKGEIIEQGGRLEAGADDYIMKTTGEREFFERLYSMLRCRGAVYQAVAATPTIREGDQLCFEGCVLDREGDQLYFEGFVLDREAFELRRQDGELVELTSHEFRLLEYLVSRPHRVHSRDELLEALAHREWSPYDRSVDVMIGKLRKKIEVDPKQPRLIKTIRGVGYKFTGKIRGQRHTPAQPRI